MDARELLHIMSLLKAFQPRAFSLKILHIKLLLSVNAFKIYQHGNYILYKKQCQQKQHKKFVKTQYFQGFHVKNKNRYSLFISVRLVLFVSIKYN